MAFSDIAVRENGQDVTYSWFNALRTAGMALAAFMGAGFIQETSFTIANNQGAAADVTGLSVSSASYKFLQVFVSIRRKTATASSEVLALGRLSLMYREETSAWDLVPVFDGDDVGVTFTISAGGQVQYTSTSIAGSSYSGTMKFKAISFDA